MESQPTSEEVVDLLRSIKDTLNGIAGTFTIEIENLKSTQEALAGATEFWRSTAGQEGATGEVKNMANYQANVMDMFPEMVRRFSAYSNAIVGTARNYSAIVDGINPVVAHPSEADHT